MIKIVTIADAKSTITKLVQNGFKVLLTGESGVGKDYVAAKVLNDHAKWCFLDNYGQQINGKWMVMIPEQIVKKCAVFVGVCDNMENVQKQILIAAEGKLALILVEPEPKLYKAIQAAKAAEGSVKELPEQWVKNWLANSKLATSAIISRIEKKREQFSSKLKSLIASQFPDIDPSKSDEVIAISNKQQGPVTAGWHVWDEKTTAAWKKEQEARKELQ